MTWDKTHDENGDPRDPVERWRELPPSFAPYAFNAQSMSAFVALIADLAALCEVLSEELAVMDNRLIGAPSISPSTSPTTAKGVRADFMRILEGGRSRKNDGIKEKA